MELKKNLYILGTLAAFMTYSDEVNPGERFYHVLIPFVQSVPAAELETLGRC